MTAPPVDTRPIVLWIHPGGLVPISGGGAARTWALIAHLRAGGFAVHLVTGDHGEHNAGLEALVDRLWIPGGAAPPSGRPATKAALERTLKGLWRRLDPDLRAYRRLAARSNRPSASLNALVRNRRPALEAFAGEIAYRIHPTAAIASYVWLAPALDRMPPGTLRLLDTIDIQHVREETARAAGGSLPHARCARDDETREFGRADVLIAIQAEEAAQIRAMRPDREVLVAGHALKPLPYKPSPAGSRELLYVGNRYDPNVIGLRTLLRDVWPAVRAACPDAALTVCGRVAETVRRAPEGVSLVGHTPDLNPYYARAAAVLNPVPYGTGLKIKTVEAMAHGRCVICTKAGAGGLGDPTELPIIVADPAADMAAAILGILRDTARRHDLEQRAAACARERFHPDAAYGALVARLETHVGGADQSKRPS
ncbi:MAG: glycosyltransferase [Candidatus Hydrogenedentes bacterium]|nr:glycosyltransferase [Candidatus Hydrogenedentota bacterium]